ncbi:transporter substrate-binding domain-containing protein [Pseudomonas sp. 10B1]|nr:MULTISPECIES: transporter substrate-binding domain-containing protein [unclassified Pseudomonas]MDY7560500.1 transporter substrate-binding domain-containing protein [Pseudomonas sp. AB6]MEA9975906.1 transporter substrate-binding domain-containing protein [Pseudomonas sp. RTS4]MEA9993257.1 transporter substrate-binding domain-containing protein [Pseudomonas sp. AA4]MEB0088128.1 transporter substrate-binding domain-containing protein [Pseudomonas sp. RTI1]MEB0124256.1 transporter substrate-bi
MCLSVSAQAANPVPQNYGLLSRSSPSHMDTRLDRAQWQWLQNKRELRLGTSAPDYPPFDMTLTGHDYEGFTADYAGILAHALDMQIKVLRFESREAAIEALTEGQIDLLGSANGFEAQGKHLTLSLPYAVDQPVLVTRTGETRPLSEGLAGMRVSMVYHYLPREEVKALYPNALLQIYPSFQSAINAVAFNQADVFLGDTISTHYLINKGYLNNVQMASFGKHEADGFSFAMRDDDTQLLDIVNKVLKAIPIVERVSISKRWNAGTDLLLTDQKLQLTQREERWIAQHPVAHVLINEAYAPLTFLDASGNFRGITADVLDLIRLRTGLNFEVKRVPSMAEMMKQVSAGQADIIGTMIPSDERESRFSFTRPYLDTSFVLVTRQEPDSPVRLDQFDGKRLVIIQDSPTLPFIRREHPGIQVVETDNPFQALDMLAQQQVQGAVVSLPSANYFLSSQLFEDKLQMSATVGDDQARISMATARDATELSSILDKALSSIAPEDLAIINNRWRAYVPPSGGYWRNYHELIYQIVIGTGLLLLGSLAWNAYMRRQIKKREVAERALNDQFEFMRTLLNGTPHPIYVRDRDGLLQTCNDSYLAAFSAKREDVIGKNVMDGGLSNAFEAREFAADYHRVMAEGTSLILDRALQIGDQQLTIYHWILPFRDSLGEVQGVIGGWIDISERRQLMEDLSWAKDQADAASRAKTTFLATMSHEIRTPMNAVIGMLELALKRADQGHLDRPAIEVAYTSARDLLELIGDILDIARIESGRLSLCPERANLRELVESVVRVFDGLARQKSLNLLLDLDSRINVDVLLDPLRFKQILSNLLSNAIKFTEQGQVKISVIVEDRSDAHVLHVQLLIQDSGIGITEEDQHRLFQPFAQADNSGHLARSGAGLGLVICRSLCEMMGGQLSLSSQPGQGTLVRIALTLTTLEPLHTPAQRRDEIAEISTPLNILIVDDHPANRLLMCQQLGFLGHLFQSAEHGADGLQVWIDGQFDLVLADCNMPVMNGYDLTRAIRTHEQQFALEPCTVLGFTANAQSEEHQRCRDAGMDGCLFKPVSLNELNQALANVKPGGRSKSSAPSIKTGTAAFSVEGIQALTGGKPHMIRRLLAQLLSSSQEDRMELAAIGNTDNRQSLSEMAHKIKGAAMIIQAQEVIEHCEKLEDACAQGASEAIIEGHRNAINAAMKELEHDLYLQQIDAY